jgi:hypothetical protein
MIFLLAAALAGGNVVQLYPGYVTRIQCEGRLLVSAVGNTALVQLEAMPKELGCGVLLKPLASGRTNLIVETSAGTIERVLVAVEGHTAPSSSDLVFRFRGVAR